MPRDRVVREYEEGLGISIPKSKVKEIGEFYLKRDLTEEELERLTDKLDEIYDEDVYNFMPYVLEVLFSNEYDMLEGD